MAGDRSPVGSSASSDAPRGPPWRTDRRASYRLVMTEEGGGRRRTQMKPAGPDRFDATIHPRATKELASLEDLHLDRLPDRYGRLRALVTAEDCARLLDRGYEVRLRRHHPVKPLDPGLVATDESVQRWIEERLAEVRPGTATTKPTTRRKR